jgi:tRNA-binding protein
MPLDATSRLRHAPSVVFADTSPQAGRNRSLRMHLPHDPSAPAADLISFDDFLKVDIRIGTIVSAEPYPEARKPAYKLLIDFGPTIGRKTSSAQITENHVLADLPGRQVAAVVNFPSRQIGKFMSQVLTLEWDEIGLIHAVIASEAKQSNAAPMDCFASLAMTIQYKVIPL